LGSQSRRPVPAPPVSLGEWRDIHTWICTAAAVLIAGAGIIMLTTGYSVYSSVGLIIIGFLISPFGLQAVIEWGIDRLADLNDSLKEFVTC
jgi:hypothetical protein